MIVTLIGYRGCGKSTVAPLLAEKLGWAWVDADVVIEQDAGCTIREIFTSEGEAGFRARERSVIQRLLRQQSTVIAAGGGAILNADTRSEMQLAGPVVWLKASLETLAQRILGDSTTVDRRPNLAGGGIDEIRQVLAARLPLYQDASTHILNVDDLSPHSIVEQLLQILNLSPRTERIA